MNNITERIEALSNDKRARLLAGIIDLLEAAEASEPTSAILVTFRLEDPSEGRGRISIMTVNTTDEQAHSMLSAAADYAAPANFHTPATAALQ